MEKTVMEKTVSKARRPQVAAKVAGSSGRVLKTRSGFTKVRASRKVILPRKSGKVSVSKIRKIIREDPELAVA